MAFNVLSCDGGGIRGYMTARIIEALNSKTSGKLLSEVDGLFGTSTGGLVSVGLAVGVTPETLRQIYRDQAGTIFTPNSIFDDSLEGGPGIFECQYVATGLYDVMHPHTQDKTFGEIFGDKLLCVNTAQLQDTALPHPRWQPRTLNNRGIETPWTVKLIDAALATSAAPTYFPPHLIDGLGYFADGGTFANNPLLNGIEVARRANLIKDIAQVGAISIGTGIDQTGIPAADVPSALDWGALAWMRPREASSAIPSTALLNMSLALSADNISTLAAGLMGNNVIRLDPVLDTPVPLDGYTTSDFTVMDNAVDALITTQAFDDAVNAVLAWQKTPMETSE
ncbi:patatin-like phospholipase family protein [Tateyamaria sp. syn59]|uniref:patatin-like phospholipase family protein n=1 Tax=Tateyamaria sp. syn59 TaxID=2576942 RepID=UPI0011BDDEF2|nr:patatin-like phospholipase family protein [Tateyamaria sp. syn59]